MDLEERGVQILRAGLPKQAGADSDEQLRERIRSSIERCSGYGFTTEEQILQFVETSYLLGVDFDSDPQHDWTVEVLTDPEMSADERAAMLVALASVVAEEQQEVSHAGLA